MPWLMDRVANNLERVDESRKLVDVLIRAAVEKRKFVHEEHLKVSRTSCA